MREFKPGGRVRMKAKEYSCKIGTMPALVVVCGNFKIEVGKTIKVRDAKHGSKPFKVRITRIDPGYFAAKPYFFAEKL